jgi:hypothetical protein
VVPILDVWVPVTWVIHVELGDLIIGCVPEDAVCVVCIDDADEDIVSGVALP